MQNVDIDAKFGSLWDFFKLGVVSTPFMLKQYLTDCFAKSALPFEIVDVFAIPDYTRIFNKNAVGMVEKYE
jgi:hypothetical protein